MTNGLAVGAAALRKMIDLRLRCATGGSMSDSVVTVKGRDEIRD